MEAMGGFVEIACIVEHDGSVEELGGVEGAGVVAERVFVASAVVMTTRAVGDAAFVGDGFVANNDWGWDDGRDGSWGGRGVGCCGCGCKEE